MNDGTNGDDVVWPQPWTLGALDGLYDGLARAACDIIISELGGVDFSAGDYVDPHKYWAAVAAAGFRRGLGVSSQPTPALMLLQLIVGYEKALRHGEGQLPEAWFPANPRARMAWISQHSFSIGMLAERALAAPTTQGPAGDALRSAASRLAALGGQGRGEQRRWWWAIALPYAQAWRRADPTLSRADLARRLQRELLRVYPDGKGPERGQELPKTEGGYLKAHDAWVAAGDLAPQSAA